MSYCQEGLDCHAIIQVPGAFYTVSEQRAGVDVT